MSIRQDLSYSWRTAIGNPAFTLVAVASLALGIGANTAIFTFVNAALLKPLPYPQADRIVAVEQRPLRGQGTTPVDPRSFLEWKERARSFESLAMAEDIPVNTSGIDGPEQVPGLWTTPELFRVLRVAPMIGRIFSEQEAPGGGSEAVLSYEYWQRRFGGDRGVLGKSIAMGQDFATIIGVLPAGFRVGTLNVDLYIPIPLDPNKPEAVGSRAFLCFGRLRAGTTIEQARAELTVLSADTGKRYANEKDWGVVVSSLRDYLVRDHRRVLLVLLGVVTSVLLIACANVAGLLLARGVSRRRELALRASLGASRGRMVQQLLIESLMLAGMGCVLGTLLGFAASRALVLLAQDALAFGQMADVKLDPRVLAFTLAISILAAVVFGLIPAWRSSSFDLQTALKEQGGGGEARGRERLRAVFVIGEVALAVVLLVGAGLLLRTFSHLLSVDLGFRPEQVLTMRMLVLGDPSHRANLVESVLDRVENLPQVQAVGTIQFLPLSGFTNNGPFHFLGRPLPADPRNMESDVSTVSRGYFAALGIQVLRGRPFTAQDRMNSPRVALVNQSFVNKYSPNQDPIGEQIIGDWANPKPTQIVGIVGDIRHNGLTAEPRPTVFLAQAQVPGYITYLVVRTSAPPEGLVNAIRKNIQQVDPTQALTAVQGMQQYVTTALARPRLYAWLLGTFAGLALILAAVGLYGLVSYTVSRRTREIGIRMALGAQRFNILRWILNQGMRLTLAGLAAGVISAAALVRLLSSLLYGVGARDVATYAVVAALLMVVALIAVYVPARRASRVDPMVSLRYE
jgi:putative ABC transport system permease protein